MARLAPETIVELVALRDRLEAAPSKGGRTQMVAEFAQVVGRKPATVYAWLRRYAGWQPQRKRRSDAGTTRLSADALEFMASSIAQSVNGLGKSTKPICVAMNIAEQNGFEVNVSASRVAALMRAQRLDPKTQARARNHQKLRSLHPNHVHQIDPSLCLVYYMGGRQYVMDAATFNKNKPAAMEAVKMKVWRYVRYDHASGCIDVRYFLAAGENQLSLFEFLLWTWGRQEGRVTHGVPKFLLWDKGSAMTSAGICRLLDALGVEHQTHATHHAWAKGGVENANWIVERHFESRLRDEPVQTVEQLNASAAAWVRDYNANAMTHIDSRVQRDDGQRHVRDDLFALIAHHPGALVELPEREACVYYMRGRDETRVINDGYIRAVHPQTRKTELYSLQDWSDDWHPGQKVRISPMLVGDALMRVEIDREGQEPLVIVAVPERGFDAYGRPLSATVLGHEHKSAPHTAAQNAAKRLAAAAYGAGTSLDEAEKNKARNERPFQHLNDGQGAVAHSHLGQTELPTRILPKAEPVQTQQMQDFRPPEVATRTLTHFEAARALTALGVAMTPERVAQLRQWHPDGVPDVEAELAELASRLSVRAGMRLIAGGQAANG